MESIRPVQAIRREELVLHIERLSIECCCGTERSDAIRIWRSTSRRKSIRRGIRPDLADEQVAVEVVNVGASLLMQRNQIRQHAGVRLECSLAYQSRIIGRL